MGRKHTHTHTHTPSGGKLSRSIARVRINRMRLPILLAVSRTGKREYFPVPVRAWEFGLARRVRPSRPASACIFSILKLNLTVQLSINSTNSKRKAQLLFKCLRRVGFFYARTYSNARISDIDMIVEFAIVNSTMTCEHACGSMTERSRGGSLWDRVFAKGACSRSSCSTYSLWRL